MKNFGRSILAFAFCSIANAQLASLQIDALSPAGGQSGSKFEVIVGGQDLDELTTLTFTHSGLTARHLDGSRFEVSIAEDVPSDIYEVRVAGRFGLSNARPFQVSTVPQLRASGGHTSAQSAMKLPFDTFVDGVATSESADFYTFHASRGQRVFIEGFADRLDSRMDATLIVAAASGVELARNRDTFGRDPFVDFTVPEDGDYLVAVHDFQFRGGADYNYRLWLNTGQHVDFVFPPVGTPGKVQRFTVFGRNLSGGKEAFGFCIGDHCLERREVEIAVPKRGDRLPSRSVAAAGSSGFGYWFDKRQHPVTLSLASAPLVAEREPNNTPANAHYISIPGEIGGQFYPAADDDWFEFDVHKDRTYWIEVISERLGYRTDVFLVVEKVSVDGGGNETSSRVVEGDDIANPSTVRGISTQSRDARVSFKADANARYRVLLRDQSGGVDPRRHYRLIIREPKPDFSLVVAPVEHSDQGDQLSRAAAFLRKEQALSLQMLVERKDGFNGDITANVEGLPAGVTASPCTIASGKSESTLTLFASAVAKDFAGTIKVIGAAEIHGKREIRTAMGAELLWSVGNRKQEFSRARLCSEVALAVSGTERAPVMLKPKEDKVYAASLAGKLEIPLSVVRSCDIKDKANVRPASLPGLAKPRDVQIDNKVSEIALVLDLSKKDGNKFVPGDYTIHAQASGTVHYRANPEAQARAEAKKKEQDETVARLESGDTEELEAAKKAQSAAAAALASATERAKPQEKRFHSLSQPIRIRIAPAPIELPEFSRLTLKQAGQVSVPVKIERLFGFGDGVEVSLHVPEPVKGISAAASTIARDATETVLVIDATGDAAPGEKEFRIDARVKLNGEEIVASRTLKIQIES